MITFTHKVPTRDWLLQEYEVPERKLIKDIIHGKISDVDVELYIDSGSEISLISQELIATFKKKDLCPKLPVTGVHVVGIAVSKGQAIKHETRVPIIIGSFTFMQIVLIMPNVNVRVLLGTDWLPKYKVTLNFEIEQLIWTWKESFSFTICHTE